jgi:hypothetical protein
MAVLVHIAVVAGAMQRVDRLVEARPALGRQDAVIQPFREHRQGRERAPDGPVEEFLRQPLGQRIDRFQPWELVTLVLSHDIIRMRHLQLHTVALDPARQDAHLADGEQLLQIGPLGMKEDQLDVAGLILADHPVWRALIAARRGMVLLDADQQRGELAGHRLGDGGRSAPVDQAGGHVQQQVDDARLAAVRHVEQLAEQHGKARPDAFDAGQRRKEWAKRKRPRRWPGSGRRGDVTDIPVFGSVFHDC